MSLDNDLNEVTEKLRHILLECLMFFSSKPYLAKHKNKISKMLQNLDSPLVIAISGHFSSGKTSLVNALINNEELLETDSRPNTSTINYLTYSEKPFAKIVYKDNSEEEYSFETLKEKLNKENITEREIQNIKKVFIGLPIKNLKFINIVDTPGLNASDRDKTFISEELTKEFMAETDGLIYTLNQATGGGSATDYNFLKKFALESKKKVIGVITKVDQIEEEDFDTGESREQIIDRIKKLVLNEYGLKEYMKELVPLISLKRVLKSSLLKYSIESLKTVITKEFEKPRKIVKITRIINDLKLFLEEVKIDSKTDEILIKRKLNTIKEGYSKFYQLSREMRAKNYEDTLISNLEHIVGKLIYANLDELYTFIIPNNNEPDNKLTLFYEEILFLDNKVAKIRDRFETLSYLDSIEDEGLRLEASNILIGTSDGATYDLEQLATIAQKWRSMLNRTYQLDKKNFIILLLEEISKRIQQ